MRASERDPFRAIRSGREALGIFAAIAAVAMVASVFAEPATGQRQGLVGAPAPDLVATDAAGATVRLADLRGHPVWLDFFSSWCANCREEDPDIEALHRANAGGDLVVLGVGVGETTGSVARYAANAGLTFRIVADPQQTAARAYAVVATPTHVFVDRDGIVRAVHIGGLRPDSMRTLVAAIGGGG